MMLVELGSGCELAIRVRVFKGLGSGKGKVPGFVAFAALPILV